jgi:C_GCAxxG_C_C family probable redox protein
MDSNVSHRENKAAEIFLKGFNCAQAVLSAFCDEFNVDRELALKLSCGLGAGMGRRQEVCGAVTGGIIVIGIKHGRGENDDRQAMEKTYLKTRDLLNRFESEHGSCICRMLLNGCDLMTDQGQADFREKDLIKTTCTPCVRSVVRILETIL